MDLAGKAAIVTGGGTGVGRATVLELARRGCHVVVNYSRSAAEAQATAEEARALGVQALAVQADVALPAAADQLVQAALGQWGRVDVLVNSAGTTQFIQHTDLESVTDEVWDRILAVNLKGAFYCSRAAGRAMQAGQGGAIVNVSSIAGIAGIGSSIPYAASKAAMNNLTITLARALAPRVRVNAVAPGFIEGRWLQQGLGPAYDMVKESIARKSPLGRVSQPEDIAAVVMHLACGATMITGQVVVVDGGMLIAG